MAAPPHTLTAPRKVIILDAVESPVNELFHRHSGVATTIGSPVTAGDTTIVVVDGSLLVNEDEFQLEESNSFESTFPVIKSGGGTNTLVLDRPIENDYTTAATVQVVETNMAVAGSIGAPVSFKITPDGNEVWHTITLTISMTHSTGSDPSRFGDILNGLPNGLALRVYKGKADLHRIFAIWKTNLQINADFGEISYDPKVGNGDFGTFATANIRFRSGAVPEINGEEGDYLEALVQDPLNTLLTLNLKFQGHEGPI